MVHHGQFEITEERGMGGGHVGRQTLSRRKPMVNRYWIADVDVSAMRPTKQQGNPVARIPLSIRYVLVDPTGIEPVTS